MFGLVFHWSLFIFVGLVKRCSGHLQASTIKLYLLGFITWALSSSKKYVSKCNFKLKASLFRFQCTPASHESQTAIAQDVLKDVIQGDLGYLKIFQMCATVK